MEAGNGKVWHRFADEKPTKNGDYVVYSPPRWFRTLPYYTESGAFNWDGSREELNTTISVDYWADIADVLLGIE